MRDNYLSAESIFGWEQSYLSLPLWADRIREVRHAGNRPRDELDYYMCFFTQCFSLRDWVVKHGIVDACILNDAIDGCDEMRICRDISNRYKHLTITKPSIDAHWRITRATYSNESEWEWIISFGRGKQYVLWDLMCKCIEFWEAFVAAYHIEPQSQPYERRFPL